MTTSPTSLVSDPSADRSVRSRRGPLAGIRVADFCWMGVGSVATRLLADFGAEVIKIEDRVRIDTPRRLPIYKDEPARNFGEEVLDADPNRGGLFNNYSRNKLGVTINMRSEKGRALAERLISRSTVVSENFAPGVMERWGLTYERLRELSPSVIYAADERLRPLGSPCRLPQLRPRGAGGERPVVHQRPAGPGALGLGLVLHGQPGRVLQLRRAAHGDLSPEPDRRGHRDRRLRHRGRDQPGRSGPARRGGEPAHDASARTTRPATAWSGRPPPRTGCTRPQGTTGGWRSPCSTTTSGPASSTALGHPAWTDDPRFATQDDRVANQDALDAAARGLDRRP